MSVTPIFSGRVEHGLTMLDRPQDYGAWARKLEGRRIELILRERRTQRSTQANRYYWGVVIAQSAECYGYEAEEMHEAWKLYFLKLDNPDKLLPSVASTTDLTPAEFEDYQERIRRKTLEDWRHVIPLPNEIDLDSLSGADYPDEAA